MQGNANFRGYEMCDEERSQETGVRSQKGKSIITAILITPPLQYSTTP
jgi:hypothetical protein